MLSTVHGYERRWDLAEAEIDRAVELNPGDPEVRAQRGVGLRGQRPPGRSDPRTRDRPLVRPDQRSGLGRTSAQPTTSRVGLRTRWRSWSGTSGGSRTGPGRGPCLAAAYAELGLEPQAREAAARVLRLSPFFTAEDFAAPYAQPSQRERLAAGFHRAGLP